MFKNLNQIHSEPNYDQTLGLVTPSVPFGPKKNLWPCNPAPELPADSDWTPSSWKKKDELSKPVKSYVVIVLDKSGSMNSVRSEAVTFFNEQIDTIKANAKKIDTRVCFVTFSSEVHSPTLWNTKTSEIHPLSIEDYVPNGGTALYDAVGATINKLSKMPDANGKGTRFLVIVISDGQENASVHFNHYQNGAQRLSKRIKELQNTGKWTFAYMGANQDLSEISETLGIPIGNTMKFVADSRGMRDMSFSNSSSTACYLNNISSGGYSSTSKFYDEEGD